MKGSRTYSPSEAATVAWVDGRSFRIQPKEEVDHHLNRGQCDWAIMKHLVWSTQDNENRYHGEVDMDGIQCEFVETTTDEDLFRYYAHKQLTDTFGPNVDRWSEDQQNLYREIYELMVESMRKWRENPNSSDANRESSHRINSLIEHLRLKRHFAEVNEYFEVAQKWGARTELTHMELAHGLANELYKNVMFQRDSFEGGAYRHKYEEHYADQIQARQIKAAKELFGE